MNNTTATQQDEIIALEHAYWDAMKSDNPAAAIALTYDPCIVSGPQGAATFDHKAMKEMYDKRTWSLDDFSIDNMNVQVVGDDAAFLAYTAKLDMTVDGKRASKEYAESSAWVRENGAWRCVLHTETPLGDPFGKGSE